MWNSFRLAWPCAYIWQYTPEGHYQKNIRSCFQHTGHRKSGRYSGQRQGWLFLLFTLLHAGFQNVIVQRGRFKAEFSRFQHLRAQPRPDELLRRHAVVGEEAQGGEGGRAQDAHPGHGFRADIGFQQKVQPHGHDYRQGRKNELPQGQPEKHTLCVIANFTVDLDFYDKSFLSQ